MSPTRNCPYVPLSKQPLVLVLGQVRFSTVRKMGDYIPAIQDEFRRHGFPIEHAGKVQQMTITPAGVHSTEQERWVYISKDQRWTVTVLHDSVVLQTTAYEKFEGFAEHLERAVRTVLHQTEQDKFGVINRVGIRYINRVQPREGEDYRVYLRPGFHGVNDEVFSAKSHRLFVESVGHTAVGDAEGTMIVRVAQNDQGFDLPPDLVIGAPKHETRAKLGTLVTLVDIDHFIEGNFEPDPDFVVGSAYKMHDHLINTFHQHVVTSAAIEIWK